MIVSKYRLMSWLVPAIFAASALIMVIYLVSHLQNTTKENQTYNRFVACALSVTANERTQDRIDQCWNNVQEDTGIRVKRYDQQ